MRKTIILFLVVVLSLSVCACGKTNSGTDSGESTVITVNSLAADSSYKDEKSDALTVLYVIYTVTPEAANLKLSSISLKLTVNGVNTYNAEYLPNCKKDTTKYMHSYTYSSYVQDIYFGENLQMISTFRIPKAELEAGRTIILEAVQDAQIGKVTLSTDEVKWYASGVEIAKTLDSEGYKKEQNLRKDYRENDPLYIESDEMYFNDWNALDDLCYRRTLEWSCFINNTTYYFDLWNEYGENGIEYHFTVRTSLGTEAGGTVDLRRGYFICTYDTNGDVIEIPWSFDEEKLLENPSKYWAPESYQDPNTGEGWFAPNFTDDCLELFKVDLVSAFDVFE